MRAVVAGRGGEMLRPAFKVFRNPSLKLQFKRLGEPGVTSSAAVRILKQVMCPQNGLFNVLRESAIALPARGRKVRVVSLQEVGGDLQIHLPIGKPLVILRNAFAQNVVAGPQSCDLILGHGSRSSQFRGRKRRSTVGPSAFMCPLASP